MFALSQGHNPNYVADIFQIKNIRKHSNADRLQIISHNFQDTVTGLNTKEGDIFVYFPVECVISKEFLSFSNSFSDSDLNNDKTVKGFFDKSGRVKAIKLRGEKSNGYIIPLQDLLDWKSIKLSQGQISDIVGTSFDIFNDILIVQKYVAQGKKGGLTNSKVAKSPKLMRLIDGQVRLHVDTENLRKNVFKISPEDNISITKKLHGSSFILSNVLVKKQLSVFEKIAKKLGIKVQETEYDLIHCSRRVVKNSHYNDPKSKDHFYSRDIWADIADSIGHTVAKGYSLYGEVVGFTKSGQAIQKGYDYGCNEDQFKTYIYRITVTNPDGVVRELKMSEIAEFCTQNDLLHVPIKFIGQAKSFLPFEETIQSEEEWHSKLIELLDTESDCSMCQNKVPDEGIVLRNEKQTSYFEAFKLKSFRFLEYETKQLDERSA